MDVREKLEVIAHLGDHISYKEDIGICYDSTLAKVIEDAYMTLKNGVTVQENTEISDKILERLRKAPVTVMTEEPTVEVVQEWISVKDRLPEKPGEYLVYGRCFGNKAPQIWICECICIGSVMGWCNNAKNPAVEAWTILPQPPKGE